MNLKISLGEKKGRKLHVSKNVEPVKNVVKLAVFSMLDDKIVDAKCLDLYAGSGNLGLEALSLGAKECTFVDNNQDCINCIRLNSEKLNFETKAEIIESDVEDFLSSPLSTKYDIAFVDPPYKLTIDNIAQKLLNCISASGVVVYLHHKNTKGYFDGFKVIRERVYGKTGVSLLEKSI